MSDQPDHPAQRRGRRVLVPLLGGVAGLIALLVLTAMVWTDYLWFDSLGVARVFTTQTLVGLGLFLVLGTVMGGAVHLTARIALVLHRRVHQQPVGLPTAVVAVSTVLAGVLAGASGLNQTKTFLAWLRATPFDQVDPYFGLDVSFFVFALPWWQFVVSFLIAVLLVCLVVAGVVHFVVGSAASAPIRVTAATETNRPPQLHFHNPLGSAAQAHLSVLLGLLLFAYGMSSLLARYGYAVDDAGLFTGIGYTDYHARITARLVVACIAFLSGIAFLINVRLRRWVIPGTATVLMLVSGLIISVMYPAIVQRITVTPNEPSLEASFIDNHIKATRFAHGIDDVEITSYAATTTVSAGQLQEDAAALPGIRLMDPAVIPPTFEQLQQVRGYYAFPPDVLDVDRYTIDGVQTDAVVAAREMDLSGIPDPTWNNLHTVYTHGYAMVAAYGNQRQSNGEPVWIVGDIPPQGALAEHNAAIYFGERSSDFAVVGAPEGSDPVELDTPGGGETAGTETRNTYQGTGGVDIGGWFNRILYAIRFGDINLLLSDRVNSESRILYNRTPVQRVQAVAPWLTVDSDPYPAVVDGRVVWILDGYTTSNSYPNSQRVDLATATSDSVNQRTAVGDQKLNYIRNSVKAVVDAYNGTVDLYAWDESDPILRTWEQIYPGVLKSKDQISASLLAHMRYPEDLFKVQRQVLGRYHMTNPQTWYQQSDLWQVPNDPRQSTRKEPPYYLTIRWPDDENPVFSQTAVYVPNGRENLGAYLAVVADTSSPDYGRLRVLRLSDTQQIAGPGQTFNAITTDQRVAEGLRPFLNQGAAEAIYGHLLTLPLGGGLLYVQPIFTQRKDLSQGASGSYPLLRFVVVRFGDDIGIGETLQKALDMVFKGDAGVGGETPAEGEEPATGTAAAQAALQAAQDAFTAADAALASGDLGEYQRQIGIARDRLQEAAAALG